MRDWFQTHGTLALASFLLAYWLSGGLAAFFFLVFVPTLVVVEILWHWGMGRALRGVEKRNQEFDQALASMQPDEACRRALIVLEACEKQARATPLPLGLPESVARVFSRVESARSPSGEVLELGRIENGYVYVGQAFHGGELRVRITDEAMFELADEGPDSPPEGLQYPSLYHWIAIRFGDSTAGKSEREG